MTPYLNAGDTFSKALHFLVSIGSTSQLWISHRQDDADVIKGRGLLVTGKMITQIWEDGDMASLPCRLSHENCKDMIIFEELP